MVYLCSNFTSNISYPLVSDFPKFIQAVISSNMFIFPFRLCEFQWRSRDNDRRMRLAGQLLHQLLKLACLLLQLMVKRMFIQTIYIQRISVDIWLECSFFCLGLVAESEHALLKMSAPHTDSSTPALPDFNRMTEEEQIAYALQMSMQGAGAG